MSAALLACTIGLIDSSLSAHADTTAGVITGEGGDAMLPVVQSLINADSAQLTPDFASYTNVDVDSAISDFVGAGPGEFGADFVVSERPLTSDESATATADGRTFAYVPFAATPVALMTLVPNSSYNGGATINSAQLCQNIPLTLDQLDGIYGSVTPPYSSWADSRLTSPDSCAATAQAIAKWGNLDPTMENEALESLLDSTTASRASFGAGLAADGGGASTTDPTATEIWPFPQTTVSGGDQAVLGKLLDVNQTTGAPGNAAASLGLGAIMPVASDWTGAPLGVTWDLPTAAVQNAQGSFVAPSAASAAAAENDAVLASTSDPTTNNLVTFPPDATDAAAYNNFLMLQSYLVVPTNGLPSDKALALAQLIRFVLGGTGQKDIASFGAAPATAAMVTAGLKVAQQLDTEAAVEASSASTTTTECSSTTSTTSAPTSSTTTTAPTSTTTSTAPTSTTTSTSPSTTTTTAPCTGTSTTTTSPDCTTSSSSTTVPTTTPSSTTASTSTTTSTTPTSTTTTTSPDCTTSTSSTTSTIPACATSPSTSSTTSTTAPGTTTTTSPTSTTTSPPSSTTTTAPASTTTTTTTTTSPTTTTSTSSTTTTTTASTTTTTTTPINDSGSINDSESTMTTDSPTTTTTAPTTSTTTGPTSTTTAPTSTTTTSPNGTTTTTMCPTTTATTATGSGSGGGDGVTTGASTGTGSSDDLAFTGSNPVPLVVLGFFLFVLGELGLRLMRKRALSR